MSRTAAAASLTALCACSRPPDVVLISIDTLRVDHVSAFDPLSPARTPHIDQLADDGIRFSRAYSPISVTGPAFCTVHTGQSPSTHGVVMNLFRGGPTLSSGETTLAEHLRARGHRTGGFVSGFTLRPELNLDQGFEMYSAPLGRNRTGAATRRQAEDWWDTVDAAESLFLWYHSFDPHGPLGRWGGRGTPDRWRQDEAELLHYPRYQRIGSISDDRYYATRYARAVRATDGEVGLLLKRLKDEGRYDDALIVFHADHGESFTERNLWFDHGFGASEEQLHVPLIVKLPGNERAGEVVERLVALEDILPTVLEVGGLWGTAALDGISLLGSGSPDRVLVGESSHCKKNVLFSCRPEGPRGKQIVARDGHHTVLEVPILGGEMLTAVYDVATDPAERRPLQMPAPRHLLDAIAPVRAARDRIRLTVPVAPTAAQSAEDPTLKQEIDALKALGYIDDEESN